MHFLSGVVPPPLSSPALLRLAETPTGSSDVCDDCRLRGPFSVVRHPLRKPDKGRRTTSLSLTELEPLARTRAPRLLPLHGAWIARQQTLLTQLLAVPFVGQAQRPRDAHAHRTRLPSDSAAGDPRAHVEGAQRVRRGERLLDVRHEGRPREVVPQIAPIDVPLARARREVDPRHAHLAPPDRMPAQLRRRSGHSAAASASGCGCWAACGWTGPA